MGKKVEFADIVYFGVDDIFSMDVCKCCSYIVLEE